MEVITVPGKSFLVTTKMLYVEKSFNKKKFQYVLNNLKPRPYIDNIRHIIIKRGSFEFWYSDSLVATETEFNHCLLFTKRQYNTIRAGEFELDEILNFQKEPRGIDPNRKANILNVVLPLISEEKKLFWKSLPENSKTRYLL